MKKILVLFAAVFVGCASSQPVGVDKYYHFAAGATTSAVANKLELPGVSSAFIAGFTKETYDYIRYGKFDTKDLIATTLGGLIVNYIIKKTNERKNKKRNRQDPKSME